MPVYFLDPDQPGFPDPVRSDSNGLLAIGGRLDPLWLIEAYAAGIFPWFSDDDPLMWWSPDPRAVLYPGETKVSKSMRKYLTRNIFEIRIDTVFDQVILNCREVKRRSDDKTWISHDIIKAYSELHRLGLAHSFETWQDGKLAGGLYGVSLGTLFFGESMFSLVDNASKFAFISMSNILEKHNFTLIDCQLPNEHLMSMGCIEMKKKDFLKILRKDDPEKTITGNWGQLLM